MESIKLIAFFAAEDGEAVYSQQKQNLELTVAQIISFSKTEENNWPARYDLNQIPYKFAIEVMNRSKGLDLVNSVPEELWTEVHNTVQEAANKTIPKKKKNYGGVMR